MGSNGGGAGGRGGRVAGGAAPAMTLSGIADRLSGITAGLQRAGVVDAGATMVGRNLVVTAPRALPFTGAELTARITPVVQRRAPGMALQSRGIQGSNYRYEYAPAAQAGPRLSTVERAVRGL